jgi:hypothetical protein
MTFSRLPLGAVFFVSLLPLFACSGGTVQALATKDGGGGGSGAGADTGDGGQGGGSCTTPTSLAGTWDIVGEISGQSSVSGTLVISQNTFTVQFGDSMLVYTTPAGPTTWSDDNGQVNLTTVESGTPVGINFGALPFTLGDSWSFSNGDANCAGSLFATSWTSSCSGADEIPEPLPESLDGDFSGQKTSAATSIFGELGGTWTFAANGETSGCQATVSGNSVSIQCDEDSEDLAGTAQATFCDGVITGTTSTGVQFSARLR